MEQRIVCLICKRRYDSIDAKGIQWRDPKEPGVVVPSPSNKEANAGYEEMRDKGYRQYCTAGHLLPEDPHVRPLIVMTTFGESQAGKGALLRKTKSLLSGGELDARGVHGRLDDVQRQLFNEAFPEGRANIITVATDEPRVPYYLTINDTARGPVTMAAFDTGYEDAANRSQLAKVATFLGEVDIFAFMVPPAALPQLPESIRKSGSSIQDVQSREGTYNVIDTVIAAMTKSLSPSSRRRNPLVYLILSKADRYRGYHPFPQHLLDDRVYGGRAQLDHGQTMADEQAPLYDFIIDHGGIGFIERASSLTGKVFLTAVSGTGTDEDGRAPADAAPNRALDPLVAELMRAGHGRFGQPA